VRTVRIKFGENPVLLNSSVVTIVMGGRERRGGREKGNGEAETHRHRSGSKDLGN